MLFSHCGKVHVFRYFFQEVLRTVKCPMNVKWNVKNMFFNSAQQFKSDGQRGPLATWSLKEQLLEKSFQREIA